MAEDKNVLDLKFLDQDYKEIKNEEGNIMYSSLTNQNNQLFIKINESTHMFETVNREQKFNLEDLHWFKKCVSKGLSDTHSTTLTTFLN